MKCELKITNSVHKKGIELYKWDGWDWRLIIRTNCWIEGYNNCKQTRLVKFLKRVTENPK